MIGVNINTLSLQREFQDWTWSGTEHAFIMARSGQPPLVRQVRMVDNWRRPLVVQQITDSHVHFLQYSHDRGLGHAVTDIMFDKNTNQEVKILRREYPMIRVEADIIGATIEHGTGRDPVGIKARATMILVSLGQTLLDHQQAGSGEGGGHVMEPWSHFEITDPKDLTVFRNVVPLEMIKDGDQGPYAQLDGHFDCLHVFAPQLLELPIGGREPYIRTVAFGAFQRVSCNYGDDLRIPVKVTLHCRQWVEHR